MNLDKTTSVASQKVHLVKHEHGSQQKIQVGYNRYNLFLSFCKIHNAHILLTFQTQLYIASHIQARRCALQTLLHLKIHEKVLAREPCMALEWDCLQSTVCVTKPERC